MYLSTMFLWVYTLVRSQSSESNLRSCLIMSNLLSFLSESSFHLYLTVIVLVETHRLQNHLRASRNSKRSLSSHFFPSQRLLSFARMLLL
ncbi:hypothetical protein NY2A_b726R [Paramecium bursaria Chlorella virus NY2A]|uniref:Uncharacterized protein b726R n=1 Tax=Paramecium bursaria Chlorella virus NY2A TaxID=46021 RepID=A7IXQ1_PBCVN|nr:hypothetical protein NY2A_b726R [Paramecium bursaria Chlorella virus NY2A]ABT15125.1 hypothetical protein NY2A_b726R [Paramecium bursaria Chlorella virus NY2A]